MQNMNDLKTLGWREWVGFPDLGMPHIKAKVDTGARTSALHAFRVDPFTRDSQLWVRFGVHPIQGDNDTVIECEAPVADQRIVRDSGGHEELRYCIATTIKIGEEYVTSDVTLTDRDIMKFRVLLGRTTLRNHFVVHPGKSYLCGKPSRGARNEKRTA